MARRLLVALLAGGGLICGQKRIIPGPALKGGVFIAAQPVIAAQTIADRAIGDRQPIIALAAQTLRCAGEIKAVRTRPAKGLGPICGDQLVIP